ncbi:MAG: hypothetical protein P8X74_05730 [Reinekea sp.]
MKSIISPVRWLIVIAVMSMGLAQATIGGKNVILIHGLKPEHLLSPPADNGQADANAYWDGINPAFLRQDGGTSNIIYWPSSKPLTGSDSLMSIVTPQITRLANEGYCNNGCVIVTHSTGDLVARYLLKYKNSLLGNSVADKFKITAVIDLAGAGGGTELANYGVGLVKGVNFSSSIISAIMEYLGYSFSYNAKIGVLNDLQPSVARNHATNGFPAIPHLRVAGGGDHFFGLTKALISGNDDSVVPLHSACGSAYAKGYDSCSRDVRIDGRVTSVSDAPSFWDLYDYHYPLIMSKGLAHNNMQNGSTGNAMTSIRSYESAYWSGGANTLAVNIDDFEKREWWDWFHTYRWLNGADDKSISTVLVDAVFR